jgi:hypothetical protein
MTKQPTITILNTTLGIIRINLPQFNLSQDNARQSLEYLLNTLPR